jgi:Tfp pilus assembly protein PilZ
MPDKRVIRRHKKRLSLKFGIESANKIAFTEDISAHGLFIKTVNILPLGSRVKVELAMPDGVTVLMEGMVRWSKRVPPQMIHLVKKSGFGIKITRFFANEDTYRNMIAELHGRT